MIFIQPRYSPESRSRFNVVLYRLLVVFAVIALFSSCFGPKKLDKWVSRHYEGTIPEPPKKASPLIAILSAAAPADTANNRISTTESKTSHFLPLLFYWQYDYKNTCTLNPQIPFNNFSNSVLAYAGRKGLKQKLNGQRLELSVRSLPGIFTVDDRGHLVWIILYAFSWEKISVIPEHGDMVVAYRVLQGETETKTGVITIPNTDKGISLKMLQSLRKKTALYLERYDENISSMSRQVVDKLLTEL